MAMSLPRQVRFNLDAWTDRLPRPLAIALGLTTPPNPEDADSIRAAQVNVIMRVSPVVTLASCFNAAVVIVTFSAMGELRPAHWLWSLTVFAMAARYLTAWRARRRGPSRSASPRTLRRLAVNGALFGAAWGALPAFAFPGAQPTMQLFVACVTAGMMCGGLVLAAVPMAGTSYVGMVAAGMLFALLQERAPVYLGITALLACYVAVIVVALNWSAVLLVNSLLAEAQVRREVAARQLAQAQTAHSERMTALGQLAGGIAHDFNNILQVVSGGAACLYKRPEERESVTRQARRIEEAVERGSAISRRLLAFARCDALSSEPIDAAALLADLGDLLAHTLGPSVRIHADASMAYGRFVADLKQLETVILNLATNARDAMPNGGDLTISAASVRLKRDFELPRLKAGPYVRIAVADTGIGMNEAVLSRVAEPFFTTKPKGSGTGLGLSMAKGFAEQSGGALAITSEPGRGTIVTLWLPQAGADVAHRPEPSAHEIATGAGRCILIVDDDEMVREALTTSLEDAGFVVLGADGANSALGLLDQGAVIEALVTDFSMPGRNGIDLIHEVHTRQPGLPAILLTGHVGDVPAAQALRKQQAEHFTLLQKPLTPARIAERLTVLMAQEVRGEP